MAWKLFCLEKENNSQAGELPGITAHCEVNMDESYAGSDSRRLVEEARRREEAEARETDPVFAGTVLAEGIRHEPERKTDGPSTILDEDTDCPWGV